MVFHNTPLAPPQAGVVHVFAARAALSSSAGPIASPPPAPAAVPSRIADRMSKLIVASALTCSSMCRPDVLLVLVLEQGSDLLSWVGDC